MIYDNEAYQKEQNNIIKLKNDIETIKQQARKNLEDEKKETQRQLYSVQTDAEKMIKKVNKQLDIAHQEINELKNINTNLIRISVERANATRNITPKKQHLGYILLNAEESNYSIRDRRNTENYSCWKIKLQTPYSITIDCAAASILIDTDLLQKFGTKIGLDNRYINGTIEEINTNEVRELWKSTKNFIFKTTLKINAVKGFWEVEYLTKDTIKIIPEILMPTKE